MTPAGGGGTRKPGPRSALLGGRAAALLPYLVALACFGSAVVFAIPYADVNAGPGETGRAALNLVDRGFIGNPYLVETGPTAHVSPLHALVLAGVFRLFGPYGHDARLVLGVIGTLVYAATAWVLVRTLLYLGVRTSIILGIAVVAIAAPAYQYDVGVDFRQWDQPWSALFLTLGLCLFVDASRQAVPRSGHATGLALTAGVGALFSPVILPPLVISLAWVLWKRRASGHVGREVGVALLLLSVFLAPWAIRNWLVLEAPIVTRSNMGLELAMGNYPGAEPEHPFIHADAARRLAAMGEVAYMAEMLDLTTDWIRSHPGDYLARVGQRIALCFFPPPAVAGWFPVFGSGVKSLVLIILGGMTLVSLVFVTCVDRLRSTPWWLFVIVPMAPYVLINFTSRYKYLMHFVSLCLIAYAIDRFVSWRALSATKT